MPSNKTTVVGVRLPNSVNTRIKALAEKQGLTTSQWCKAALIRAAGLLPDSSIRSHHKRGGLSVNTIKRLTGDD